MRQEWEWHFRSTWWRRNTRGMTAEEKGNYMDDAVDYLDARERSDNDFANLILDRAEEFSELQRLRRTGGSGDDAAPPPRVPPIDRGKPRLTTVNHGAPTKNEDEDEDEEGSRLVKTDYEDEPPTADGSVSSSDNSASFFSSSGNGIRQVEVGEVSEVTAHLLERMRMASNAELPGLMAAYCDEGGNQKTLNSWRKFIRVHGVGKFRDAVIAYVYKSETEGEEPKNRGAAFNSFLKQQKEAVV